MRKISTAIMAPEALTVFFLLALFAGCEKKTVLTAPEFSLKDTEGKTVKLSDYKGKVVMLEFFATWCPPCKMAVPDTKSLSSRYKDKGLVVLAISLDGEDSVLEPFVKEQGITYPVLFDDAGVRDLYYVKNIPTTFVIDKEGVIKKRYAGYMPGFSKTLSADIEELL